jgi:AraC family transcriptional regulator
MKYKIVEKPSFSVVGRSIRVPNTHGENQVLIPKFWDESVKDGTVGKLASMSPQADVIKDAVLGICMDFSESMDEFSYMIAVDGRETPDGMISRPVPAAKWAVFEAKGPMPEAIQNVWAAIWSQFFAVEPYADGPGPELEIYPNGDINSPEYISEVWVPVVSK